MSFHPFTKSRIFLTLQFNIFLSIYFSTYRVFRIRVSYKTIAIRIISRRRDNYRMPRFLAAKIDRTERSLLHHQLSLLRLQLTDFADLFQGIDLKLIK